jgi:hypothetical protein
MLFDEQDSGGSDGIYSSVLQGPNGPVNMPLALHTESEGLEVNCLDATPRLILPS